MLDIPELVPGQTRESLRLDFKARYWSHDPLDWSWQLELAKDVAALANASGGHIIVGAVETGGLLKKFRSHDADSSWASDVARITGNFIVPGLGLRVGEHTETGGQSLLVFEVEPSPRIVCVRDPKDERRRFCVPVRRLDQTIWLPTEQAVEMLTSPHRSIEVQLMALMNSAERVTLAILQDANPSLGRPGTVDRMKGTWWVEEVTASATTLANSATRLMLPLVYVEAVWQEVAQDSRNWRIRVRGRFNPDRNDESRVLFSPRYS